jgi:hypothetical protein
VAAACLPAVVSLRSRMKYLDNSPKVPSGPHKKSAAVRRRDTNVVIALAQLLADLSLVDDPAMDLLALVVTRGLSVRFRSETLGVELFEVDFPPVLFPSRPPHRVPNNCSILHGEVGGSDSVCMSESLADTAC